MLVSHMTGGLAAVKPPAIAHARAATSLLTPSQDQVKQEQFVEGYGLKPKRLADIAQCIKVLTCSITPTK